MKKLLVALALGAAATALCLSGTAMAKAKYELKLATVVKAPHPWVSGANYMADEMKKRTNGDVDIKIFEAGSLGNDKTAIDQMRLGTIDFVIGGTTNAASFVKEYQVFSMDYLFENMDAFRKVTAPDSPVVKKIQGAIEDRGMGFKLLALCSGGTRNLSNNLKPVSTPADLEGMKMRVPGAKMAAKMWSALGALPTSLPWTEVYSAVQTGVVNAFESSISGYRGSKLYEVAPYHSKTEHQIMASHISMSTATFNRLPAQYQKDIVEVAAAAGIAITDTGVKFDEDFLADLAKRGAKINEVDKAAFIEKLAPLHATFAQESGVSDLFTLIRSVK